MNVFSIIGTQEFFFYISRLDGIFRLRTAASTPLALLYYFFSCDYLLNSEISISVVCLSCKRRSIMFPVLISERARYRCMSCACQRRSARYSVLARKGRDTQLRVSRKGRDV